MIDAKICPICKKPNLCQADVPNNSCWCNKILIPEELKKYIPPKYKMKACICKECVEFYIRDKNKFVSQYG